MKGLKSASIDQVVCRSAQLARQQVQHEARPDDRSVYSSVVNGGIASCWTC